MAYDVSALEDYTNEQNFPLLRKTVFGAKTAGLFELQTGIKSEDALNRLETSIVLQDDDCSREASGDDTFTQRKLKVGKIAIHKDFCPKKLEAKAFQTQLKSGSTQDEMPFEAEFTDDIASGIAKVMEVAIWQGDEDEANTDPNTNKFDGILKHVDEAGNVVNGNTSEATEVTTSNIMDLVDDVYTAIPEDIVSEDDVAIMMGVDNFRLYTKALKDANLFHYDAENNNWELVIPGTNVRLYGLNGLNGTDRMVAGRLSNFYVGVDLEDEDEDFEIWYSKDDRVVKFTTAFKYGTQIAFPEEVVEFTVASE